MYFLNIVQIIRNLNIFSLLFITKTYNKPLYLSFLNIVHIFKEDCDSQNCCFRKCPKRHRRSCRYGGKCKRRESCEFIHKEKDINRFISNLEAQVETLKSTVAEMTVKFANLEKEIQSHKAPSSKTKAVASEEFKFDKCGVVYKKEATLRRHINTKHQLEPAEVDQRCLSELLVYLKNCQLGLVLPFRTKV